MKQLRIRNLAICRIEDGDYIFVFEGYDSKKDETFYRPLGGGIEFGELASEAAAREFREELGAEIIVGSGYHVYENIFEFNGQCGHEIVFVIPAHFKDEKFYERRDFIGREDGANFIAKWVKKQILLLDIKFCTQQVSHRPSSKATLANFQLESTYEGAQRSNPCRQPSTSPATLTPA